ncbi:MAG: flagellar brake protein [Limnobacter sp.]|nr:flagellar brake protein [Limnobacter sp.]
MLTIQTDSHDLLPLPKADIEVGTVLKFPIYDGEGVLLLAQGKTVESERQLEELAAKGMYQNPRWARLLTESRRLAGSVVPDSYKTSSVSKKQAIDDPTESGNCLKMSQPGQDEDASIVKLVGTIGKQAFIVSHPMKDGSYVFAKEGQVWNFRSFYGTSVYRFSAQVEKVYLSPFPMIILTWPLNTKVEQRVVRAARRANCDLPATLKSCVESKRDTSAISGVVTNLSTGGAEFTSFSKAKISLGDEMILAFQICLGERRYLMEPRVRVMSENREEGADRVKVGVAFVNLNDCAFATIHGYVTDKLIRKVESPLYARD